MPPTESDTAVAVPPGVRLDVHLRDGALASLPNDVRDGLSRRPKQLPPKYLYDQRGSNLFEEITRLPEYYPTRTEQRILDAVAPDVIDVIRPDELLELGPGSARKTHALLEPLLASPGEKTYVPVDVSESAVREVAARLAGSYDGLEIHGVVGDFEQDLPRLRHNGRRRLIAFLGGTLGNLDRPTRRAFLNRMRSLLEDGDGLLIGTDLVKDKATIEAAYNDSAGVTAEFNRNVLHVINSTLGADFEPKGFDHVAFYDEQTERIEMRLRARNAHAARISGLGMEVEFESGEEIRTEISCKFTREKLTREYALAGLRLVSWFTDEEGLYGLSLTAPT
jgi:L-histidine N-alpha-methyltransferase